MQKETTECTKCILSNNDDKNITFDKNGVCNYCHSYDKKVGDLGSESAKNNYLKNKINEIKLSGKGRDYDCILGVSGGVDSSYLAYWAKENGLRPLVVHFDNGWNSELATANIKSICEKLNYSLNTHVINWEEFKEMQLAYFKAGVVDIEVLTDHAIMATIFKVAAKYKIKYTLNGFNYATEAIMPKGWVYDKTDWLNIKDIIQQFGGTVKIKTYPHVNFLQKLFNYWFLRLESIQVLNFISYNKHDAKKIITEKIGWRDYGGKHYESVFTKFYQAYILPTKFKIDKRRAHLSNLICSGQITREYALEEMLTPLYDKVELEQERNYILKKLGLTESEFAQLMDGPIRDHSYFKTEKTLWIKYFKIINLLKFKLK